VHLDRSAIRGTSLTAEGNFYTSRLCLFLPCALQAWRLVSMMRALGACASALDLMCGKFHAMRLGLGKKLAICGLDVILAQI